ncbi:MAG TPA: LPS assembly lipoprotein LptE [Geminicoccus sp.]|uniref:LPS assembly lipoprotein LptE n=1 Tax=Geminicoccus sp. TaxID=2024832 RepID=UPI002C6A278D|nr:LPS assembly lipoprotein LptE [Geminicoccus sp.]HWL69772.1 LPS assembly lipoprotein LptE [Geminicoccus sp.]
MASPAVRRRSLLVLPAGLALAGCGFQPLYGEFSAGQDVRAELASVNVIVPHGRLGQTLKAALATDLNPSSLQVPADYDLAISIGRTTKALAIQLNATITRYDLILDAVFSLNRRSDGVSVYRNRIRRIASYNVSRAPYSTQVAEEDAERRAAVDSSRQIAALLAVFFREQNQPADQETAS